VRVCGVGAFESRAGAALLKQVEAVLKSSPDNATTIDLQVHVHSVNDDGIRFYVEQHGFTRKQTLESAFGIFVSLKTCKLSVLQSIIQD
jgi:hypothetical protein